MRAVAARDARATADPTPRATGRAAPGDGEDRIMTRARLLLAMVPLAVVAGLCPTASAARADSTSMMRGYAELGMTRFTRGNESGSNQFGIRISRLDTGGPSADIALAGILAPAIIVLPDLDLAWPIALGPDARLVPRAGVSAIAFAGYDFGGFVPGGNVGLGLVIAPRAPVSLRMDYTIRAFPYAELEDDGHLETFSVGLSWRSDR